MVRPRAREGIEDRVLHAPRATVFPGERVLGRLAATVQLASHAPQEVHMRRSILVSWLIGSALSGTAGAQGFDVRLLTDSTALGVPGIDPEVSINEQGAVAFVAGSFSTNAPYVWSAGQAQAVAPTMPSRQYF